jgi:hypothetical protein
MDPPASSQPRPPSPTTENPVVAVWRKVKAVLTAQQRPSIRILREPLLTGEPRRVPLSKGTAEKLAPHLPPRGHAHGPQSRAEQAEHYAAHAEAYRAPSKGNASAHRFADARNRVGAIIQSLFSREANFTDHDSVDHEYDPDTVDLLDVVGMCDQINLKASKLTLCRPRSSDTFHPYQCSKFSFRPFARKSSQSSTYV